MFKIPLAPNSKVPPKGIKWTEAHTDDPQEHNRWLTDHRYNIGLPMDPNNLTVVDFDQKEVAREFYKKHKELFKTFVETRKGIHLYFKGLQPTRKLYLEDEIVGDIKSEGSYVVYPPSIVEGWHYMFLDQKEPPEFPHELFPVRKEVRNIRRQIKNVRAYVRKITSVEGENGSDSCFKVACVLRDEGLSEAEALAEMIEWNNHAAFPPWSVPELLKKVRDAFSKEKSC